MKQQFIELNLPQETYLWLLSGNHIFISHAEFLFNRNELEHKEELDEMMQSLLTFGEKLYKVKGKFTKLRLIEAEYRCLIFSIQYTAFFLLTDEGESWLKDFYFPKFDILKERNISSEEMQKGFIQFADAFLSNNPSLPAFVKIKKEVATKMDELFPEESI